MKTFGGGLSRSRNIINSDVSVKLGLNSKSGLISATETTNYDRDPGMSEKYKDSDYFTPLRSNVPSSSQLIHNTITDSTGKPLDTSTLGNNVISEDPLQIGDVTMRQMNLYNAPKGVAQSTYESYMKRGNTTMKYSEIQAVINSLFNPYYGLDPKGVGPGQWPVAQQNWDADKIGNFQYNYLGDCRISTLVNLSKYSRSILGQARYKYSDFMFCKELGMPNNHLITLRRYSSPIGDQIHGQGAVSNNYFITSVTNSTSVSEDSTGKNGKKTTTTRKVGSTSTRSVKNYDNAAKLSDIGHLCCYFDGEDNKLQDIIKYSFKQTYKTFNSEIQRQPSKEDDRPSLLGSTINTLSPGYRQHMANSTAGNNNLLGAWGSRSGRVRSIFGAPSWYHNEEAMYHVDKNKIYEPKNTIQEIDYYEGKIQFQHEFTLVFSYELRAYDNISSKAAMLDLIGNVLRTCGTVGNFWGGARQINGPSPNSAGWNKAQHLVNNTWDALGSGIGTMFSGGFSMDSIFAGLSKIMGSDLGNLVSGLTQKAADAASALAEGAKNVINGNASSAEYFSGIWSGIKNLGKATGFSMMAKAKLKDALGRPQIYAWDSLLSGGDTGMWHITIGNPLRPIMTFGNLEVVNTTVEHSGPLGIDDFPTKLKVTVQLKHARPRDIQDIEKMYAFGSKTIYKGKSKANPQKVYTIFEKDTLSKSQSQNYHGDDVYTNPNQSFETYDTTVPANDKTAESTEKQSSNTKQAIVGYNKTETKLSGEVIGPGNASGDDSAGDVIDGIEYVGDFDWARIKANMDELYQ